MQPSEAQSNQQKQNTDYYSPQPSPSSHGPAGARATASAARPQLSHDAPEFRPGSGVGGAPRGRGGAGGAARGRGRRGGGRDGGGGRGGLSHALDGGGAPGQEPRAREQRSRDRAGEGGGPGPAPPADGPGAGPGSGGRGFMSANHLLNFRYDSYGGGRGGRGGGARGGAGGRRRPPAPRQRYDRNKFLQANFRFLVSDAVDEKVYGSDPDAMFDWEDVLQVEMTASGPIQCPISLDAPPECPQITPCGHVYSFASIMRHLTIHGGEQLRRSAPCPLCFQPVVARELRLVTIRAVGKFAAGDAAKFTLLRRPRDSVLPATAAAAAAAAPAAAGAARRGGKAAGDAAADAAAAAAVAGALAANPFGKYATASDAAPLWREAALRLARAAARIISEGGSEASVEVPPIFAALDSLAVRARRFAERRGEALEARGLAPPGAPAPDEAGRRAEAAVRAVFSEVLDAQKPAAPPAAGARPAAADDFPALPVRPPAPPAAAAAAGSSSRRGGGGGGDHPLPFDHSFSEDEADAPEGDGDDGGDGAAPRLGASPPGGRGARRAFAAAPAAPLGASPPGAGASLLGSSPGGAGGAGGGLDPSAPGGDYYFYQSSDGQWLFLHPLNCRVLLSKYGSYSSCPPEVTGRILELEPAVQDEALRRRSRFLSHLPMLGAFEVAEVQITDPAVEESEVPAALAEELAARERRRRRRADAERRASAREAAAARAAAAAKAGPSLEELRAMPALRPGAAAPGGALSNAGLSDDELASAAAAQLAFDDEAAAAAAAAAASPPAAGVSFALMTRMGFAASGPTLGSAAVVAGSPGAGPAAGGPPLPGAWGARAAAPGGGAAPRAPGGSGAWGAAGAARAGAGGAAPAAAAAPGGSGGGGGGGADASKWLLLGAGRAVAGAGAAFPGAGGAPAGEPPAAAPAAAAAAAKKKSKKGTTFSLSGAQRRY